MQPRVRGWETSTQESIEHLWFPASTSDSTSDEDGSDSDFGIIAVPMQSRSRRRKMQAKEIG